jgi:hypothetical protein
MLPGNLDKAGTGRLSLGHDPQLIVQPPAATTLNPGDDLLPRTSSCP